MGKVNILSGGAAMGLVRTFEPEFRRASGAGIEGSFGAVGAMKEKLEAGTPCDVVILTEALILALAAQGKVDRSTVAVLGRVSTGIAVCTGGALPRIEDREALRGALQEASALYFPDPQRATAGIHFKGVLEALAIGTPQRTYPNGAEAMKAMALSRDPRAIGCTQVTEILYTQGVHLVGPLPKAFALETAYAAAVVAEAPNAAPGRVLVELLASPAGSAARVAAGFN